MSTDLPGGPLDLTAKLYQEFAHRQVSLAASGEQPPAPLVVELDPTSFCDLACPECISGKLLNSGRFSDERLTGLAAELVEAGVEAVILIGGGEPLLHSAIGKVITLLHDGGISVGITTNGTTIHRHIDVLAEHANWTRVSVDAATAETYGRFRPGRGGRNRFAEVVRNMELLASRKSGKLGYSFLVMGRPSSGESNVSEIAAAAELAKRIGCDYFEVKPEYDREHFILGQDPRLLEVLSEQLARLRELDGDGFKVLSPATLGVIGGGGGTAVEVKDYTACPVADLRTLITTSGAYFCPYHRGNPAARYGDPETESFAGMWNGDLRRRVREDLRPDEHCRFHCIRHGSNLALFGMRDEPFEPVPDYDPFL
ncbi:radical SAM protein [Amycolatopsis sp. NPDC051071]|uniref:radical SAM protein n=1 Tax=Amycolatopsis sp. NPDC051071 TaxID=3154637 RepID=UPI003414CE0E